MHRHNPAINTYIACAKSMRVANINIISRRRNAGWGSKGKPSGKTLLNVQLTANATFVPMTLTRQEFSTPHTSVPPTHKHTQS